MPSRAGRSYLVIEGLAAAVLVFFAPGSSAFRPSLQDVGAFLAVLTLLSLFDIWLPHGDTVDVVGALAVAALVILGPIAAIGIVASSRLVTHVLRYRLDKVAGLLHTLSRRTVVLTLCALLVSPDYGVPRESTFYYAQVCLTAVVFVMLDLLLQQAYSASRKRQSLTGLLIGNVRLQGLMMAANVSVAILTVLLYHNMGAWSLALMVVLLVVMRQSFSMLLDIRQAYQSTMEALAAAIEAHDPDRQGHAERVAALARAIATEIGIRGTDLERLGYAALLHDVDLMAADDDADVTSPRALSSEILGSVRFLTDVLPILRMCEGRPREAERDCDRVALLAYIVCRASNLDELLNHEADKSSTRLYSTRSLELLGSAEARQRVEGALWKMLTPGARAS